MLHVCGDMYVEWNKLQKGEYFSWSCHLDYINITLRLYLEICFIFFSIITSYRLLYTYLCAVLTCRFHTWAYCSCRSVTSDFKDLVLFHFPPWRWWGINFHEPLRCHGKGHESCREISWSMKIFTIHCRVSMAHEFSSPLILHEIQPMKNLVFKIMGFSVSWKIHENPSFHSIIVSNGFFMSIS